MPGDSAVIALLLSHLLHQQQLSHLNLSSSLRCRQPSHSAAAYSAVTGSSKLQHLDISGCMLPAGAWQELFPAGRQLPHLQVLDIQGILTSVHSIAPDGSCLVSCCPGLRALRMENLQHSAELLAH
jgi:hypothetical protein